MNRAYPPGAESTKSSFDSLASSAQEKVASAADAAQGFAREQYGDLTIAIRRNPLQAAAIAAGIGFVLALLARR
jgi:ElaB/YqjD/DUF883 family membrane-anchored ribosome-binding protein